MKRRPTRSTRSGGRCTTSWFLPRDSPETTSTNTWGRDGPGWSSGSAPRAEEGLAGRQNLRHLNKRGEGRTRKPSSYLICSVQDQDQAMVVFLENEERAKPNVSNICNKRNVEFSLGHFHHEKSQATEDGGHRWLWWPAGLSEGSDSGSNDDDIGSQSN